MSVAGEIEELLQFLYLMPIAVIRLGPGGAIEMLNPKAVQLLSDLDFDLGKADGLQMMDDLQAGLAQLWSASAGRIGPVVTRQRSIPRSRGTVRHVEIQLVRPDHRCSMLVLEDVTTAVEQEREIAQYRHHLEELVAERTASLVLLNTAAERDHQAAEQRIREENDARMQSRKLEAIGTLAAGIAHDFNNILGSIVGFAEMVGDELPADSIAKDNVGQILSGCFRARDLIAQILEFARERRRQPMPVDIVTTVREALALLKGSLQPSIELDFHSGMGGHDSIISADPTQIMQIVMNLCINAAHALNGTGAISVCVDPARNMKTAPTPLSDGICMTVGDNGKGMAPDVLDRIYDPFFTTKAPGEGSGLGLSVVYGIVTGLGGVIEVQSSTTLGASGTKFRVYLPRLGPHPG